MPYPGTVKNAASVPFFRRRGGFTLLEMLVALTVISVGVAVFVGLFDMALTLSRNARDRSACLDIARSVLDDVARNPGDYEWPEGDGLQQVALPAERKAQADPPRVLLPGEAAKKRMEARHSRYRWRLFAQKPAPDNPLPVREVTVVVQAGESSPAVVLTAWVPDTVSGEAAP